LDQLDKVSGGAALGNIRILATIEYAVNANLLVGVRGGIALGTFTGTAAANDAKASQISPVHLELRGTYLFGKDALMHAGLAPYITLGGGYAPFDTKVPNGVTVKLNGQNKTVDAYNVAGPIFATGGGGVRYALSGRAGILFGVRLNLALGNG